MLAGEVSFHAGWTFHRAEGNSTKHPRKVMTAIYMDKDIRAIPPAHANHKADYERCGPWPRQHRGPAPCTHLSLTQAGRAV